MSDHGFGNSISVGPFKTLVELVGRAFYDDITTRDNRPKSGRSDNEGIVVVVLDALTRFEWVREDDLAKYLKLHSKQLRRILRFLEEEKVVTREHRKETAKAAKIFSAVVDATTDKLTGRGGDEKAKLQTHSYCCLDYAQIIDGVRYRLHRLKKKLKDELDSKNTVQEYVCPRCTRRYTALDAVQLVSFDDDSFHCERCNAELVVETDKLAAQEMGDGDDNARRRRHEKLKVLLQMMEVELKPLTHQLNIIKDLEVPEFGTLQAWEVRANAVARAVIGDSSTNDSRSGQGLGCNGTLMPFVGETKVEVAFSGVEEKGESIKTELTSLKVLPPWMIKQGMNLAQEQRGAVKQELKMEGTSTTPPADFKDAKPIGQDDAMKDVQDEYIKAYYAALLQRQQELETTKKEHESCGGVSTGVEGTNPERQTGMKSKRNDHDDIKWADLRNGVDNGEGEDDDGIDWEEG